MSVGPSAPRRWRRGRRVVDGVGRCVAVRQTEVASDVTGQRVGARNHAVDVIVPVVQLLRRCCTQLGLVTSSFASNAIFLVVDGDEDEDVDEKQEAANGDGDAE